MMNLGLIKDESVASMTQSDNADDKSDNSDDEFEYGDEWIDDWTYIAERTYNAKIDGQRKGNLLDVFQGFRSMDCSMHFQIQCVRYSWAQLFLMVERTKYMSNPNLSNLFRH